MSPKRRCRTAACRGNRDAGHVAGRYTNPSETRLQQPGTIYARPLDALNFFLADVQDGLGSDLLAAVAATGLTGFCAMMPETLRRDSGRAGSAGPLEAARRR